MAVVQDELAFEHQGVIHKPVMIWDDDDDDEKPVVLVCGTILGRNEFVIERARELQKLGYVAVVLDFYGNGLATEDFDLGRQHMTKLTDDREELRERLEANIACVLSQPVVDSLRVVIMGYCFGGLCALDAARTRDDIVAAISFHGVLTPPPRALEGLISTKILVLHGHEDPLALPEAVTALQTELTARGADWQVHVYGSTYHSFTNPEANAPEKGSLYNETAQARSWQACLNFITESVG